MRRRASLAALAGCFAAGLAAASASASQPPLVYADCHELFAALGGEEEEIRSRVPVRYELAREGSGRPLLLVLGLRCRGVGIAGAAAATTVGQVNALIRSPDGSDCFSRAPVLEHVRVDSVPGCRRYPLAWVSDNRDAVEWLRAGTPGLPVRYVRDLVLAEGALDLARGGVPASFRAGAPTPSPYRIDALYRDRPGAVPMTIEWFAETAQGTVRLTFQSDAIRFGDASGTLEADEGSQLARMLGAPRRQLEPPFSLFGSVRWQHGELTKQLLSTEPRRERKGDGHGP